MVMIMTLRAIHLWVLVAHLAQVARGGNPDSVQWINPSAGTSLTPGTSVEAKWTSNQAIKDPSFSLCTADARCGQATPATIVDNPDGTTSALLSLPNVNGDGGMFLQMNDQGSGAIHQSPTFKLDSVTAPKAKAEYSGEINERVPSPAPAPRRDDEEQASESGSTAAADEGAEGEVPPDISEGAEASRNPYKWDEDAATPTTTISGPTATDFAEVVSSLAKQASLTGEYPLPTSLDPSAIPTAYPSQWPFSNPYAALNMTSIASSTISASSNSSSATTTAAAASSADDGRPNAAIIAVPLSICGAIMLASLLFCARSRMKKQKDLESGPYPGGGGPPGDWQAMIKRKACDTNIEKGSEGVGSVTITERRDDAVVPTLGYTPSPRQPPPPPAPARGREAEPKRYQLQDRYADDMYTRYEGMHGRAPSYDRRDRDRDCDGEYARRDGWRQRLRDGTLDGYWFGRGDRSALSSRTGSGTRCLTPMRSRDYGSRDGHHQYYGDGYDRDERRYDDRYARHSRSSIGGKGSRDKWDGYDRDRGRDHSHGHSHYDHKRHEHGPHHRLHRKDEYYSPSRRSRSGLGGMPLDDRCDCASCMGPPISHRHSSASGCVDCHRQESSSTTGRPRTPPRESDYEPDLPGPTYSRDEPMIRTRTSSSFRSLRRNDLEPQEKVPIQRTSDLRRADTSMSVASDRDGGRERERERGWDLAGKGAYETAHGRTMGELYESLRRAIGESEAGMERMRSR